MENLKFLEVEGEKLKILWKLQYQVCLLFFSDLFPYSDTSNVNITGPSHVVRSKYYLFSIFRISEVHREGLFNHK